MADGWVVVLIKPPANADSEAFEQSLTGEVLPAVHQGPTRVGGIDGWDLLERTGPLDKAAGGTPEYVWIVRWSGLEQTPGILLKGAFEKLQTLGARVSSSGYDLLDHDPEGHE